MPYPLCEHVMSSGLRCGSPARRGQTHCHYHTATQTLLPKRFHVHENFRNEYEHGCRLFPMPLLEDATSIQTALMQVIHAMLEGAIHVHTARIVLSALRTAQRNLPAVKLEMAATCATAAEWELPSDARQKAAMTWPNRADDQWETSYIGRNTVSPAHLNGDLGQREPKIPPNTEDDNVAQEPATHGAVEENANASAPPLSSQCGESASAAVNDPAGAPQLSPHSGERVAAGPENHTASPLPFRKQPQPLRGSSMTEPEGAELGGPPRTEPSG